MPAIALSSTDEGWCLLICLQPEIGIDSLHHGGAVTWYVSFIINNQMQSWCIHLLQPEAMPIFIKPLADGHSRTRCCSGSLRPQTDSHPVTAIMLLKVSGNTPDKVIDGTANTHISGLIVRHPLRHLTC